MHTPLVEYRLARTVGGNDAAALIASRNARTPMGRMGTAWDVAHAVLFLASDEAQLHHGNRDHRRWRPDPGIAVTNRRRNAMSERRLRELTPRDHDAGAEEGGRCDPVRPARCGPARSVQCAAAQSGSVRSGADGSAPMCGIPVSIPARLNEMAIIMAGRKWTAQYRVLRASSAGDRGGSEDRDLRCDRRGNAAAGHAG